MTLLALLLHGQRARSRWTRTEHGVVYLVAIAYDVLAATLILQYP